MTKTHNSVDMSTKSISHAELEARLSHLESLLQSFDQSQQAAHILPELQNIVRALLGALENGAVAENPKYSLLQAILHHTPAIITVKDKQGRYLLNNKRFNQVLDGKRGEIVGKTDYDFFPPYVADAYTANDKTVLKAGYALQFEEAYRQQDGMHTYLSVKFPLSDNQGQVRALCSISTDITERKRAEDEVRKAKVRMAEAQHLAGFGNWEMDMRTEQMQCSDEIFHILNQPVRNTPLHYDDFLQHIHPLDQAEFHDALMACEECHEVKEIDFRVLPNPQQSDNTLKYLNAHLHPLLSPQNKVIRIVGSLLDISKRKQAEQALQENEDKLSQLLSFLPIGVVLHEADGRLSYLNQAAQKLLGANVKVGLPLNTFSQAAQLYLSDEKTLCAVEKLPAWRVLQGETMVLQELEVRQAHLWHTLEVRAVPVHDEQGKVRLISVALQDISERRAAEKLLQEYNRRLSQEVNERTEALRLAKEEAEAATKAKTESLKQLSASNLELAKANQMKDEFLAAMSHELRTPLNAILGMSEVLMEKLYGDLSEKQEKYLNTIHSSGKHLLSLINDILDLSKIEAGKLELNSEIVDINTLCQASILFVKETAKQKNVHLYSDIKVVSKLLNIDQRRIKQVLINLLTNAVKFTSEGGSVGLDVTEEKDTQAICFSVWDTGLGIPEALMPRLFQPFTQLDGQLNRQHNGTGLGLALVKRLAELHGGSIAVHSEVNKGSRFDLFLPCEIMPDTPPVNKVQITSNAQMYIPPPHSHSQDLILLVEDNSMNLDLYADYLHSKGYQIMVARTGEEALQRVHEQTPRLILMDIQMPGMDGLEATRRIRTEEQFRDIPIVALTALTMPGDRERCLAVGMNDYLSKPLRLSDLLHAIEELLGEGPLGEKN